MEETITLHANQSGRLWTEDPDAWARLCTPEGCPICTNEARRPPDAPPPDWILAETPILWATAGEVATLPGGAGVCCKRHVVEPYELSPHEQAEFWQDSMLVAQGLADVLRPVKMNYEIHGNTIPHLHMHLFPRTPGDVYVGYVIHSRAHFTRSQEELQAMRAGIRARLAEQNRLVR
jgi:diadenosine tetraphosphate (Ap4A) HIT family hydrolase